MDKLSMLKTVFIFKELDETLLKQLVDQLKEAKFKTGGQIFREGMKADAFYIVDSGEVVISKELGPGNEKVLALLGPGSVFGEMAFFSDSPRTAKAAAKTDSALLKIERADFLGFIKKEPQAGLRVLEGLLQVSMERLEQTSRELATVYQTGKIISSGKGLPVIAKGVMDEVLLAVPDAEKSAFYIYNEFNQDYDPLMAPPSAKEIPELNSDIFLIKKNQQGTIFNEPDSLKDSIFANALSVLAAPILKDGKLQGFLSLWNTRKAGVFKNSHLLLLMSVAGQLAEAIENIKHQQEENDRRRLNTMKDTSA
ncbi:MAG: cyclic nucleotide-binding domain-containing protein [Elusimicrobiota bacterium]